MKIAIAGHSGFIGKHLCEFLIHKGHSIVKINRIDLERINQLKAKINSADAIINLCGSSIFGSWSDKGKETIINSRIFPTRNLNVAISELEIQPKIFINASAVGIYNLTDIHDDESTEFGSDFPSQVVRMWENEFYSANFKNTRKVALRMGVVIDKRGGFFKKIYQFHRLGFLPAIINEDSSFPIIALNDLLRIFDFILTHSSIEGSVNAVLPMPVTSKEFYYKVRSYSPFLFLINIQPKFLIPFFGTKILTLTLNPKVFPRKLLESGFKFDIPEVDCYLKKLRG